MLKKKIDLGLVKTQKNVTSGEEVWANQVSAVAVTEVVEYSVSVSLNRLTEVNIKLKSTVYKDKKIMIRNFFLDMKS